jgi:glucose dehydrogenase
MVMRYVCGLLGAAMAIGATACGPAPERSQGKASNAPEAASKGPTVAPGDWPLINRDLTASRYSPLNDITAANVANLTSSFTYQLGGNSTAVPIVVGGVMYLPS